MNKKFQIPMRAVLLAGAAVFGTALLVMPAHAATTGAVGVAPGMVQAAASTTVSATVVGIDAASREVKLKGAGGKVFTVTAGAEVHNFAQIKLGDTVIAQYTEALSLELKKAGTGVASGTTYDAAARAKLGAKPAGGVGRIQMILADVTAVDSKTQLVTLRGPEGNVVHLKVQDPEQLKNIKKGDQVEVVYSEALAVSVESAPKAKAKAK